MAGSDQNLSTEPHWCGIFLFPPTPSLPFFSFLMPGVECHVLSVATSQGIVSTISLHGTILFPGFHFQNSNTFQHIITTVPPTPSNKINKSPFVQKIGWLCLDLKKEKGPQMSSLITSLGGNDEIGVWKLCWTRNLGITWSYFFFMKK